MALEIHTWITGTLKDAQGHQLAQKHHQGNSMLGNFAQWLTGYLLNKITAEACSIKEVDSSVRIFNITGGTAIWNQCLSAVGGSGAGARGIQVGSGTAPVALDNYNLAAVHTTFTQTAVTGGNPIALANGSQIKLTRSFINETAGSLSVNECGIQVGTFIDSNSTLRTYLLARDLTGPYVVEPSQSLDLEYQIDIILT